MVTAAGKIPDNWKLSYSLAGHTDQELHAAQQGVATMYSIDQPGSGLVPSQTVYRKIPPFQSLADPAAAISATKYSHLHLNGLPASQSAAASPLGFISNKLIAFGQAEILKSRHRGESELQDELLQTIPSLQEVEYAKTGKAAKLKLPLVAFLTFKSEKDAAATYTYRSGYVPLMSLHPDQSAGHLSIRKYAAQQMSRADREHAIIVASSPDFAGKDAHPCLDLLIKQTPQLLNKYWINSPKLNAFEFSGLDPFVELRKPINSKRLRLQCTSVAAVHGLLALDTMVFDGGLTVTFSAPHKRDQNAPSKASDAYSLVIHEVATRAAPANIGAQLLNCIEQSSGCNLVPVDYTGLKIAQLPQFQRPNSWSRAFWIKAANKEDFVKVLRLNHQQTFGANILKVSAHSASIVGNSVHHDARQLEWVQMALKDRCTYHEVKQQAQIASQPATVSQTAPIGMADVLSRLNEIHQHNRKLEGAIQQVSSSVQESGTAVLQVVQEGTTATTEVSTAIQAIADTQNVEVASTQLQLKSIGRLAAKVDNLDSKVDRVAQEFQSSIGLASKRACETIEEEMRLLRKAMNMLSPSPPSRDKRQKIAKGRTPPQDLNTVGIVNTSISVPLQSLLLHIVISDVGLHNCCMQMVAHSECADDIRANATAITQYMPRPHNCCHICCRETSKCLSSFCSHETLSCLDQQYTQSTASLLHYYNSTTAKHHKCKCVLASSVRPSPLPSRHLKTQVRQLLKRECQWSKAVWPLGCCIPMSRDNIVFSVSGSICLGFVDLFAWLTVDLADIGCSVHHAETALKCAHRRVWYVHGFAIVHWLHSSRADTPFWHHAYTSLRHLPPMPLLCNPNVRECTIAQQHWSASLACKRLDVNPPLNLILSIFKRLHRVLTTASASNFANMCTKLPSHPGSMWLTQCVNACTVLIGEITLHTSVAVWLTMIMCSVALHTTSTNIRPKAYGIRARWASQITQCIVHVIWLLCSMAVPIAGFRV